MQPSRQASAPPLFRFGDGVGSPLAMIAGSLIFDNGEAEATFLYRCQDRFLAYSSLWGLTSVFFAAHAEHVALYRRNIARQREGFARIAERSGLFAGVAIREPLFALCDIDAPDLARSVSLLDGPLADDIAHAARAGLCINQISPTYAGLLRALEARLAQRGLVVDWRCDEMDRLATLAQDCSSKHDYVALVRRHGDLDLPPHVETVVLGAGELASVPDFETLARRFGPGRRIADALFIKSTLNSAGNLAVRVTRDDFSQAVSRLLAESVQEAFPRESDLDRQVAELRAEVELAPSTRALRLRDDQLRAYKLGQTGRRRGVEFLVQPELRGPSGDSGRFAGIGLSYVLDDRGAQPLGATAQIYRDPERKHFLGAYVSSEVEAQAGSELGGKMAALCRLYSQRGYRGPINFDARRDGNGDFQLIYDCNPRLTGVLPSLAVRDALLRSGAPVRSVLSLGYRGEWALGDLDAALDRLEDAGLLFGSGSGRGAVLLPNLCRDHGFDMHLINVAPDEAQGMLSPGGAIASLTRAPCPRLYP
jgi:hypothetical protein